MGIFPNRYPNRTPRMEFATPRQRAYLEILKVEIPKYCTKAEASRLIDAAKQAKPARGNGYEPSWNSAAYHTRVELEDSRRAAIKAPAVYARPSRLATQERYAGLMGSNTRAEAEHEAYLEAEFERGWEEAEAMADLGYEP